MSDKDLWINREGNAVNPQAPDGSGGPGFFKSARPLVSGIDLDTGIPHPFSHDGRNLVPTDDEAQELEEGGIPGGTTPDELPTFTSTTGVPNDVRADTVDEFASGSNAAMGGGGTVGHMQPDVNFDLELDGKGKVTKVNMVVNTQIVRPRFAGGRGSDSEKALIKKAEELIKAHEERHRDIAKEFMTRACKAMRGKTGAKAQEVLKQFIKDMDKAQADFDAKEGQLIVEHNGPAGKAGPATDVKTGPVKNP